MECHSGKKSKIHINIKKFNQEKNIPIKTLNISIKTVSYTHLTLPTKA